MCIGNSSFCSIWRHFMRLSSLRRPRRLWKHFYYSGICRRVSSTSLLNQTKVDFVKPLFLASTIAEPLGFSRSYCEGLDITLLSGGKSVRFSNAVFHEKDKLLGDVVGQLMEDHGINICVIETSAERRKYADYVVVVSGGSTRHLKAMTNHLYEQSKKNFPQRNAIINGLDSNDWMIVDYDTIVVHLFLPEVRAKYELEKLWSLGPDQDEQYQAMLQDDQYLEMVRNAKLDDFFVKEGEREGPVK